MNKVNKHNYEEYLIDFADGNLSQDDKISVQNFLDNNPDIKAEFDEIFSFSIAKSTETFGSKVNLYKNDETDIEGITGFEQLSVAKLENDITTNDQKKLDDIIKHSEVKNYEHRLIQRTKLVADKSIYFPNKLQLKHLSINNTMRVVAWVSVAASIILMLFITGIVKNNQPNLAIEIKKYKSTNHKIRAIRKPTKYILFAENINKSNRQIPTSKRRKINTTKQQSKFNIETTIGDSAAMVAKSRIVDSNLVSNTLNKFDDELCFVASKKIDASLFIDNANLLKDSSLEKCVAGNAQQPNVYTKAKNTIAAINKQDEYGKQTIVAQMGKSLVKSAGKFIKKRIRIRKYYQNDGSRVLAIETRSLKIYASTQKVNKHKR